MVDSLMNIEPDAPPPGDNDEVVHRRAQFAQANASLAIEGLVVDELDAQIQDQVAQGLLTAEEAVALYLRTARKAST